MNKIFLLLFLLFSVYIFSQEKERLLNKEELELFQLVNKYHKEIKIPKKAVDYFNQKNEKYKVDYIYSKKQYENEWFAGYGVSYLYDSGVLNYEMSVGLAYTKTGEINVIHDVVIMTDYSYGTGAGTIAVIINGVEKYKKVINFE